MEIEPPDVGWTTWHIVPGTYGPRLHGGDRPTVDRAHNEPGEDFIWRDESREQRERRRLKGEIVIFSVEQCRFLETVIPAICERGGWRLRVCAAPPPPIDGDHVHVLVDVRREIHGKRVREWLKRWMTEGLNEHWPRPNGGRWWAHAGSTRVVDTMRYRRNVTQYIARQRATPNDE